MNNDTSEQDTSTESTTQVAENETQTVEDQGQDQADQSQQGQPENNDESFFDPNLVPEELKPAYKQMQGAFTKKTQEIAAIRKEYDALKGKSSNWSKYEQYVPILEEMLKGGSQNQEPAEIKVLGEQLKKEGYTDEAIKLAKINAQWMLNMQQQKTNAEAREKEIQRINSDIDKAGQLDQRLTDPKLVYDFGDGKQTFGQIVETIVNGMKDWRKDPITSTRKAIAIVDALIGKAKVEGKQELSDSASNKAKKYPSQSSSPQSSADTSSPMTFKEAAAKAARELGI